jgi:Flp pilus assembly protein TadG
LHHDVPLSLRKLGGRFARSRRATTALELAIVGSIFIGCSIFLLDLGFVLYTQVALDFAASRSARLLSVDNQQKLSGSQANFQAVTVCPLLSAFLACNQLTVALVPVTDYLNGSIPSPTTFSQGQGGSLMLLQLSYQLPAFAAPLAISGVFATTKTVTNFPFMNEY